METICSFVYRMFCFYGIELFYLGFFGSYGFVFQFSYFMCYKIGCVFLLSIKQISGKLRQGKGVLMVYFVLRAVSRGYRVLTNFNVNLPNCVKMDYYDFLYLLKAKAPEVPTLIAIDELPTWIEYWCDNWLCGYTVSYRFVGCDSCRVDGCCFYLYDEELKQNEIAFISFDLYNACSSFEYGWFGWFCSC